MLPSTDIKQLAIDITATICTVSVLLRIVILDVGELVRLLTNREGAGGSMPERSSREARKSLRLSERLRP
jgi:hypothetical protein